MSEHSTNPFSLEKKILDMHSHVINKNFAQFCISDGVNVSELYLTSLDIEMLIDLLEVTQESMRQNERN